MTDAEKMLQTMMMLAEENKENQQNQYNESARQLRMLYDSYISAGFSNKMAFELVKTFLSATIQGIVKK